MMNMVMEGRLSIPLMIDFMALEEFWQAFGDLSTPFILMFQTFLIKLVRVEPSVMYFRSPWCRETDVRYVFHLHLPLLSTIGC